MTEGSPVDGVTSQSVEAINESGVRTHLSTLKERLSAEKPGDRVIKIYKVNQDGSATIGLGWNIRTTNFSTGEFQCDAVLITGKSGELLITGSEEISIKRKEYQGNGYLEDVFRKASDNPARYTGTHEKFPHDLVLNSFYD